MGPTARARLPRRLRARAAAEGGFTLVELIVTLAVLLIVVASLSSVLVSATRTEADANSRFQAQEQARTGLAQLTRELHCASSVTVTDSLGAAVSAPSSGSRIAATVPSTCATSGGATLFVTWCTSPSTLNTSDWALYRVTSTTSAPLCSASGKIKWADYLTTPLGNIFCLPGTTLATACGGVVRPTTSLPMLHVAMPVNLKGPGSTIDSYNVVDDIALRNAVRS
ncbi:MAG TPA: prepilin-type N-terminal cleavage/methylation domain-containing protein [Gaiellaceae bacterium]|jgi:prepilin-type N-terminal cleavage/methylation domain-containing protein